MTKYRYVLHRDWGQGPFMGFIMLNPSTADERADDPTIRRCVSFAKHEGYDGIAVANLFSLRATDPADLLRAGYEDAVGVAAEGVLATVLTARCVVAAWGHQAGELGRWVRRRKAAVLELAAAKGVQLYSFGKTRDGSPRHPLYLRGDAELRMWP